MVQILDHHSDSGAHSAAQRAIAFDEQERRALVGSCCTLVHETLQDEIDAHTHSGEEEEAEEAVDRESAEAVQRAREEALSAVALPLLGVVLLDTLNMDGVAAKGTDRDRRALCALRRRLSLSETESDALYAELCAAKTDPALWDSLSVCEALRFDYKTEIIPNTAENAGFSSVLLPVSRFVDKPALWDSLSRYFEEQRLRSLVVMSLVQEPAPHRELLVVERASSAPGLASYLQSVEALQLTPLSLSLPAVAGESVFATQHSLTAFVQGNVKMSRKQVLPLVVQYYQQ